MTGAVDETDRGGPQANGGDEVESFGNRAPEVDVPAAATIPVRTPFALTGGGSWLAAVTPKGLWRTYWAPADQDLPTILQRGGTIVPTGPIIQHVQPGLMPEVILSVVLDAQGKAGGTLYEDAGDGYGYLKGEYSSITYAASKAADGAIEVKVASRTGSMGVPNRPLKVQVLLEGPGGTTRIVSGEGTEGQTITIRP